MRAGRLKTRRYRIRKSRRRAALVLLLLGAGLFFALRDGLVSLPDRGLFSLRPAASPLPEEARQAERLLTLPGGRWYALEVGAFDDLSAARQAAESFRARGAGGYVLTDSRYQVLAAAYASRADAQKVQQQLRENHGVDTVQAEIAWPEIQLRVRGREAQLNAMEDACAGLAQLPNQLAALSAGLDQDTLDFDGARSALASYRDTLLALSGQINARFDSTAPEAVGLLAAHLSFLANALDDARASTGSTRLGGQVKYCQLAALCLLRDFSARLSP